MWRKLSFALLLACSLVAIIYWLTYVREAKTPIASGITAIPTDAVAILRSTRAQQTWKKLDDTNIMWEELQSVPSVSRVSYFASYLDSLLKLEPAAAKLLDEQPAYLSLHEKNKSLEPLFVYSLPNLTELPALHDLLKRISGGKETDTHQQGTDSIIKVQPYGKPAFFYILEQGTLILGPDKELVRRGLMQLKSGNINTRFSRVLDASGNKVDASIFIDFKKLRNITRSGLENNAIDKLGRASEFAETAGWDITLKPNALMMSGFCEAGDSTYLKIFADQKPQSVTVAEVLPASTVFMRFTGISDFASYQQSYEDYLRKNRSIDEYQKLTDSLRDRVDVDLSQLMGRWINSELVFARVKMRAGATGNFALFRASDPNRALEELKTLSDSVQYGSDSSAEDARPINRLRLNGMLATFFGAHLAIIKDNYYTSVGDFIVFSNSVSELEYLKGEQSAGRSLSQDKSYQSFIANMSDDCNVYLYSAISKGIYLSDSLFSDELSADIKKHEKLLRKFECAGIQFSSGKDLFYSNGFIQYNPEHKTEASTLWECALDTTLSERPYMVLNHKTGAMDVFAQDINNKIYLISNTGKILWTRQLNEKIMSSVMQIDALKNDKLQMIFNTRTRIFVLDRNGNELPGFPLRLPAPATNSISLTDYDNNREYRIFIACEDRSIRCYQVDGKELKGFKAERTKYPVFAPVQYFRTAKKDHLCAVDQKGNLYILNRQGEKRVDLKEKLPAGAPEFFLEPGNDYAHSYILAADTLGIISKISFDGKKESIKLREFENTPWFSYRDLNEDKLYELIFVTPEKLHVFAADRSLLFSYDLDNRVISKPQFFRFPDGETRIGLTGAATPEVYLFHPAGTLTEGFPLTGNTAFSAGDLNGEKLINIVTGGGTKLIYTYQTD
jgi:hypothetical protein